MPYNLIKFDGTQLVTVADGLVDNQLTTSINFIGKNVTDYGTIQNDNFLWLLENFAATTSPVNPIQGQIWFNSAFADPTTGILRPKVYDGGHWRTIGITEISPTQPAHSQPGDLWFDSSLKQLWVQTSTSSNYSLIGPELVVGFNETKWASTSVTDTSDVSHPVVSLAVDGHILMVSSNLTFDVSPTDPYYALGVTTIHKGLTLVNDSVSLYGNVEDARYTKTTSTEYITGIWNFRNINGISIGAADQANIKVDGSGNLVITDSASIIVNSPTLVPSGAAVDLGTSSLKYRNLYVSNINAGTSLSTGILIGDWNLSNSSKLHPVSDLGNNLGLSNARWNTVYTQNMSAGSTATGGTLEGQWTLTNNSKLTAPTVQTPIITAGSAGTSGTLIGQWVAGDGSSIHATAVVDTSGNTLAPDVNPTASTVPLRDNQGGISASTFNGNLSGNVTGNVSGNLLGAAVTATSIYGALTGNVLGNLTGNVAGNVRGVAVTATNLYGSLNSTSITAGSNTSPGSIVGKWAFSSDSSLQVQYVTAGNYTANGQIDGQWRLTSRSTLQATSLIDGNGSVVSTDQNATGSTIAQRTSDGDLKARNFIGNFVGTLAGATPSTSSNTINTIVSRDGSGNFSANAISAVGSITTPSISAGANSSSSGTIKGRWTLTPGSTLQATYADVAENYTSDEAYDPGTLVMFGGEKDVTLAKGYLNTSVAGVVSTNPAHLLNAGVSGVSIALVGRVPCKVVGNIKKGDMLVTSAKPGVATTTGVPLPGSIIAKAMEDYNSSTVGVIEVMVWRG